ncbi:MAG: hypothetical protein RBU45_05150 [Myxococcota bacterium]|nr:hypothetical protein [Myxococcota bacterium]
MSSRPVWKPVSPARAVLGALLTLPLLLSLPGCPMGDCWGEITVDVTIAEGFGVPAGTRLALVVLVDIGERKVSGVDAQGLPIPAAGHANLLTPRETITLAADQRTASYTDENLPPYPTYVYAFLDLDEDGVLDPGEPFGVAPANPYDRECSTFAVSVLIDRTYPS